MEDFDFKYIQEMADAQKELDETFFIKKCRNCKVVAWMPLPNPYKEKLEYENNC